MAHPVFTSPFPSLATATALCGALLLTGAPALAADGKAVYEGTCSMCHAEGMAESPIFGNKEAWAPRIAKGLDTLVKHALEGFEGDAGMMPERGGNDELSDAEVKAAVLYMMNAAK